MVAKKSRTKELLQHFYTSDSLAEIAEKMQLKETTVSKGLVELRKKLREQGFELPRMRDKRRAGAGIDYAELAQWARAFESEQRRLRLTRVEGPRPLPTLSERGEPAGTAEATTEQPGPAESDLAERIREAEEALAKLEGKR